MYGHLLDHETDIYSVLCHGVSQNPVSGFSSGGGGGDGGGGFHTPGGATESDLTRSLPHFCITVALKPPRR